MRKVFSYLLALLSLLSGLLIYLIWRDKSNPFYQRAIEFGLSEEVNFMRNQFSSNQMPSWFIYSLPDGLWMFSFMLIMLIIWNFKTSGPGRLWVVFSAVAGLSYEISQAFIPLIGIFDWFDLSFIVAGISLPYIIFSKQNLYEKVF